MPTIIQLFRVQYILCKNFDKMLQENDMRIRFIISLFPFPNFKYVICRFLLTCVRINIYKVISRDDYILLWFTFYVNWHLSNSRYHILPYHVDTYVGFVEFPQNDVYFNWSAFWSTMVNPRFFIKFCVDVIFIRYCNPYFYTQWQRASLSTETIPNRSS